MKNSIKVLAPLGLAAIVAFSGFKYPDTTYDFKAMPKGGTVIVSNIVAKFPYMGQDVTFKTTESDTVSAVNPDGSMTVSEVSSDTTVAFGGQTINPPADTTVTKTTSAPDGSVVKIDSPNVNADAYRLSNLTVFLKPTAPVKMGDSWMKTLPANKDTAGVGIQAKYTVVAEEKVGAFDAIKVHFVINETEGDPKAGSEGDMWIDKNDGQSDKVVAKMTHVTLPGTGPVDTAEISQIRIK